MLGGAPPQGNIPWMELGASGLTILHDQLKGLSADGAVALQRSNIQDLDLTALPMISSIEVSREIVKATQSNLIAAILLAFLGAPLFCS